MQTPDPPPTPLGLRIDRENECLWRESERLELPPKAYALLAYLADHPARLVTKDELLTAVWPETFVGDAVLKVNVKLIRDRVGDDARNPWLIETVHRRGYRLLQSLDAPVPSAPEPEILDHQAVAEPLPALIGREAAARRLHSCWQAVLGGQRRIVFVTGEAGIGKTALVRNFVGDIATGSTIVGIGRGHCVQDYGANEAYLPVLDALEDLLRGARGEEFGTYLQRCAPTWVGRLPGLLGADNAGEGATSPGASRERMLREIASALEMASAKQPIVLLLEDLHWSDPSTATLLAFLGQRQQSGRLLVVGTYRPVELIVETHPLKQIKQTLETRRQCEEVALDYLNAADVLSYLEQRLGGPVDQGLVALVGQRTNGNPLFVVSVVDHLVEAGLISKENGVWRDPGAAAARVLPQGLRAAIEQRLGLLDEEERLVLQGASVQGTDFYAAAAAAVVDLPSSRAEAVCERLAKRGEFLRASGVTTLNDGSVSGRYEFLHVLYQNVLYDELAAVTRIAMHRRAGAWGEAEGAGAGELAYHFSLCGNDENRLKAIGFARRAAARASRVFAHDEVAGYMRMALATAEQLQARDAQLDAALRVALAEAQQSAGEVVDADLEFRQAATQARALGDIPLLARAATGIGQGYQRIGQADPELIGLLEEALAGFGAEDPPIKALTLALLDYSLSSLPDTLKRRRGLADQALAIASRCDDVAIRSWVLQYTRWSFRGPQRIADLRAGLQEVEVLIQEADDVELSLTLQHLRAADLFDLGEMQRGHEQLAELLRAVEETQLPWFVWMAWRLASAVALLEGRLAEAEGLIAETHRHGKVMDHPNVDAMYAAQLALLAIERGQLEELKPLMEAGVEAHPDVPTWRAVAAYILAENGEAEAAARHLAVLAENDFETMPQDTTWPLATSFATATAALLGERVAGAKLHALLLPYRERSTGLTSAFLSLGHAERYVGLAAAAAGFSCAVDHLEIALRENLRNGALPWVVLTQRDLANVLAAQGGSEARVAALRAEARESAARLGMAGWLERI